MSDGSTGGEDTHAVSTATRPPRVRRSYGAAQPVERRPDPPREPAEPREHADEPREHAERISRARYRAALRGDPSAFADLCAELSDSMKRAVERHMAGEGQEVCDECVDRVVARVFELAFDELDEKPADWSMYGWMSWLAVREITRFPCSTPR